MTAEKIKRIGFPEYVYVQVSLYSEGNLHQIGNPVQRWLEGHFVSVFADNLEVGDGSGAVGTQPFAHVLLVTNATYAQNFVLPIANNVRNGSEKLRSTGCECRPLETNVKHDIVAANKKQ